MEDSRKFEIFKSLSKNAEDCLEEAVTAAETYEMSENQAVDMALKSFFLKMN